MQIRAKYDQQEYELPEFGPSDFVAFERQFKVSASALSDEGSARFEWLCFLVYRGLKRAGVLRPDDEVGGFTDDFIDRIQELKIEDADEEEPAGGEHGLDPSDQAALPG